MTQYCSSRFVSVRRKTREVKVGNIGVGAGNPIRIQSMTTTVTTDVAATVKQSRVLVEAGCEIVRITAPNNKSAKALGEISRQLRNDKIEVPLVADIHFLPSAAMEAVEHVEKVRVNPGNYVDKKKFQVREYSDKEYDLELERLYEAFTPLVLRSKELGRSMRIGTNHGSLSDRLMNRFGDSPLGMVESALEFVRIAESHNYKDIILSMKASNPKVMIQAYRLVVSKMNEEGMDYPLHLGVTEAGDGEDGRIKSAIGIGSLLVDGLGDTIRVSLTEDPVYEVPVAKALAEKTSLLWQSSDSETTEVSESVDPYSFTRRETKPIRVSESLKLSSSFPPRVFIKPGGTADISRSLLELQKLNDGNEIDDTPIEGWCIKLESSEDLETLVAFTKADTTIPTLLLVELGKELCLNPESLRPLKNQGVSFVPAVSWNDLSKEGFAKWLTWCRAEKSPLALGISPDQLARNAKLFLSEDLPEIFVWAEHSSSPAHTIGDYRLLVSVMKSINWKAPLWIRCQKEMFIQDKAGFLNDLLEVSLIAGGLLSDGVGDILSVETVKDSRKALFLAYNTLQGAGARISKTEYVACPSCGRTLFDLQQTTQKIRSETNHLKGVKIAVMGCIVNGPGEMADADFGYVGGAPGKVNLYIGKDCIEYHVDENEAVERLIDLIKQEGKWFSPKVTTESGQ